MPKGFKNMKNFLKGVLFVLMIILVLGCGNENDEATPVEVVKEFFNFKNDQSYNENSDRTIFLVRELREQMERMDNKSEGEEEYHEGGWHRDEDIFKKAYEMQSEVIELEIIDYEIGNDIAYVYMVIKQPKRSEYIGRVEDMMLCAEKYEKLKENTEKVLKELLAEAPIVTYKNTVELHREDSEWKIYSVDAQNN